MDGSKKKIDEIKNNVRTAYTYFKENYQRYHTFRRWVFKESVTDQQRAMLSQLGRPLVEFNILDAYISRLLGEFAMQEPSINISPADGTIVPQQILDIVEGHLRHIISEADKNSFSYEVYKDLLSGGFSVGKVWTDYAHRMSMNQEIKFARVFDPTLAGFDPMARAPHKGDGRYSFELFPMTLADVEMKFPNLDISDVSFNQDVQGFNWAYKDMMSNKILLLADYYEKVYKRTRIMKLSTGAVVTKQQYAKIEKYWDDEGIIEQIPKPVGKMRWTDLERIHRYQVIGNDIISEEETDYRYLPHVFIDGHSINLTVGSTQANTTYQMTRPYVYHAKGVQDMVNFAGQTVCNSMENLITSKFIVMKEAIPQEQDYVEALNDLQRQNTIVVNAFYENNPAQPIPTPIREIQNAPLPGEVLQAFQMSGPLSQTILGSFASNLGKNDNDLSGRAVVETITQGNAASMPYVVGYLAGLTQMGVIAVDLMPKYIKGERNLPIVTMKGEAEYAKINGADGPIFDYQEDAINVHIEAGVNFQVQKNRALESIVSLMQASPEFAQFMNSPQGLPILVKNLTIYGANELQEAIPQWLQQQQQMQQQQAQMQQQAMQQNPQMIKAQADQAKVQIQAQELQMKHEQQQVDNQFQIAKLSTDKILADAKLMESEAKISQAQIDSSVRLEESETSRENHSLDAAVKLSEMQSRQHNDQLATHELAHKIRESKNES